MKNIRPIFIALAFLILTLPLMPLQWLLVQTSPSKSNYLAWIYHRLLCKVLGISVVILGKKPEQPALLISNHVSWIDIPILGSLLPLSFIAKREVGQWPLFGIMAKLQRCVFVNRESRQSTGTSTFEISSRLGAGDTIVLFAEGTSNDGNMVKPFKSSFFAAAEKLKAPIIPVTVAYRASRGLPLTRRNRPFYAWYGDMHMLSHLWNALRAGPMTVSIHFHDPLMIAPRKLMATSAEQVIRAGLAQALHGKPKIS